MIMPEYKSFSVSKFLLLLLLLAAGSNPLWSANLSVEGRLYAPFSAAASDDLGQDSSGEELSEEYRDLFESILPFQKDLHFATDSPHLSGNCLVPERHSEFVSLNYLKSSRYILPSLGIRELLFPFHVFF